MPSAPMVNDVKETRKPLMELGGLAGFHIHKWILNEPELLMLQKKIGLLR